MTIVEKYIKRAKLDTRSYHLVENIIGSFLVKGASILISLLLVPLTINYIDPTRYGIWLTLSSIVAWFNLFDIGFGNGLRNRFTEAQSNGNVVLARNYLSTTYISIGAFFLFLGIVFIAFNSFIDWSIVLNAPKEISNELSITALSVFSFFCIQMALKPLNTLLIADQKPAKAALIDMLGQALSLIVIFVLVKTTDTSSLLTLALALTIPPVIILILATAWYFYGNYKTFKPSFKYFDIALVKDILSLGLKFFVAQIAGLIMYQTSNIMITQLSSPLDVTKYNIVFRYFNVLFSFFMILVTPLWSSYTEAYVKNDTIWMVKVLKRMRFLFVLFVLGGLILLLISSKIYIYWIGDIVNIPFTLSILMCLYVILQMWVSLHTYLVNGIGKVQLQLYFSFFEIVMYLPISFLLGKAYGINGVLSGMIFFAFLRACWTPIQLKKLLNKSAKGVWAK